MSALPDWWKLLDDTNNYLRNIKKWEDIRFFPNVMDNDYGWNIGFKFWDYHISVHLAWSPQPVLHDSLVEWWLTHDEATLFIEQFKIAMCNVKFVDWLNWQKQKRTAIKVIAKRIFDESDLS